jgi:hypothetical protein
MKRKQTARQRLKTNSFADAGIYLKKKIQELKQKIREHLGTKMIFNPKIKDKRSKYHQ